MTTGQILLALIIGLVGNECCDVSPWLARKLIRWSAHRHYAPPSHAELRAEELTAYINDCPGRLFKLLTALGFAAKAIVTRKVSPGFAQPTPQWQPTTLTVPVHYEDSETEMRPLAARGHPQTRAVKQAWCQLIAEICSAAKEAGMGSQSWRRSLKKLIRITGDERWILVSQNLDYLGKLAQSTAKLVRTSEGSHFVPPNVSRPKSYYWSFVTDSTITHYQAAVETARAEIRSLTSDFLLSSTPR